RAHPSGARAGARFDGLAELLDGVAQRLLLQGTADGAGDPEADVDRLRARRLRALAGRLEAIGALDVLHVRALDEPPRAAVRRLEDVLEGVPDGLERHVEREGHLLAEPVVVARQHAALLDGARPARVVLEPDEHGEAVLDAAGDHGRVRLRELRHARRT